MALIFSKFQLSPSQTAMTSSPIISDPQLTGPQSTALSVLREMLESYATTEAKNSFRV